MRLQLNLEGQLASDEYAYKPECGLRIQTGHLRLRCGWVLHAWHCCCGTCCLAWPGTGARLVPVLVPALLVLLMLR